jgi:hypothetical protein
MSWHTTLITRIKSTAGYTDELPITYIDKYFAMDGSVADMPELNFIMVPPYGNYKFES